MPLQLAGTLVVKAMSDPDRIQSLPTVACRGNAFSPCTASSMTFDAQCKRDDEDDPSLDRRRRDATFFNCLSDVVSRAVFKRSLSGSDSFLGPVRMGDAGAYAITWNVVA